MDSRLVAACVLMLLGIGLLVIGVSCSQPSTTVTCSGGGHIIVNGKRLDCAP